MSGMMAAVDRQLEEDELYDILSNERRRLCVRTLQKRDGAVDVQRLADSLAAELGDGTVTSNFRQSIYISLVQTHLPKLHGYGVVEYDEENKTVRAGRQFPEVDGHLLDGSTDSRERWIAAGVSLSIVVAAAALVLVYGSVGPTSRTVVSVAVVLQAVALAVVLKEFVRLPDVVGYR